ncbi:alpha/beta fold hydrolase [Amycolatopsis sp. CA-230715]|uniref:alpha/beta fold hydrolase n=1 Tax=Amycolatopsis sp. CA-230715 TaxID=2745196 RepID=UPI001C0328A0|nr:alpha/beta hydrolase [Amycolatopsis sp. CA-230715]QWF76714.1 2-hydroxy-6-oxononadienedioate/2-hydroxy-6-oxononatrienedioate hydrolase [Amycolatopsis sp. CA-230715]
MRSDVVRTRLGPIECAREGDGLPVLVLHGTPGGVDAAGLMAGFLPRPEFSPILVSRPGYLGTELGARRTVDEQADLLVALLDELGIDRAALLSWSGGGPVGYRIAARHPGRVRALVAFAALSKGFAEPPAPLLDRVLFGTGVGQWLLRTAGALLPRAYVTGALDNEGNLSRDQLRAQANAVLADPAQRAFLLSLIPTTARTGARKAGCDNDFEQFAAFDPHDLGSIAAPTLIVHGDADTDVPPDHGAHAAAAIPGARLRTVEAGTHLCLYAHPEAETVQREVTDFLRTS